MKTLFFSSTSSRARRAKRSIILESFVAMLLAMTISCSFNDSKNNKNISLPLPKAFATTTNSKLRVDLVVTQGSTTKTTTLKITDGVVSGTLNLKPGIWTLALEFYWKINSNDYLPVAFVLFGEKTVGESGLDLTYVESDIKFDLADGETITLSIDAPADCSALYDCDGDKYSNFTELSENSDPQNADEIPTLLCGNGTIESPEECDDGNETDSDGCNNLCLTAPIINANLATGDSVQDTEILSVDAVSNSDIKRLIITSPILTDTNNRADAFDANWDTTSLTEDKNTTLKFLAEDTNGHKATLNLTVKVDNAPNIVTFGDTDLIQNGESTDLTWDVNNYTSLEIDNDIGTVTTSPATVDPEVTTTYTITAIRDGDTRSFTSSKEFTLSVNDSPVFGTHTTTAGQDPASGTTLSWTESDVNTSDTLTSTITVYEGTTCTGDTIATQTSTTTSTSISNLEPRTDYSYKLTINDGRGGEIESTCEHFTTSDTGLVGWWRFDEGSGTEASDTTGDNNGLIHDGAQAIVWTTGVSGSAIEMDGVDDYVDVAGESLNLGSGDFTIEAFVQLNALPTLGASYNLLGNENPGNAVQQGSLLITNINNVPAVRFFGRDDGGDQLSLNGSTALTSHTWNHVVATRSGSQVKVYLNGQLEISGTNADMGELMVSGGWNFGRAWGQTGNNQLNGLLDEVTIYNRALSTQEIRDYCQRSNNDCAADDVPTPRSPENIMLPPTRAFLSWEAGITPAGKTFDHYQLCYATAGEDISSNLSCLNPKTTDNSFSVLEHLTAGNTGYRWKVKTCYNDDGTDCSAYSPVWSFSTDASLTAWWKFDDGSGTTLTDASGRGNNGTLNGGLDTTGWTTGMYNGALQFDGVDDFVQVPDSTDLEPGTGNFSVEAWVKHQQITDISPIISKGPFLANCPDESYWMLDVRGDVGNILEYETCDYNVPTLLQGLTNGGFATVPTGDWTHIAVVHTLTDLDTVAIYLNDQLENTVYYSQPDLTEVSSRNPLYIGYFSYISLDPYYFHGLIDEVALYNKSLSAAEATNSYCAVEALSGTTPLPAVCR